MNWKNIFNNLSLFVLVLAFPIYTYLVLSPNINNAVFNINELSGIDLSNSIIIEENSSRGLYILNSIYFDTYQFFYLFTFAIGAIGVLVMYKGRTAAEIILLYLFMVIPRQRKFWGIVYDDSSGSALSLAVIRLYEIGQKNILVDQQVSDFDGKYRIDLPNAKTTNNYLLTVNVKGYVDYRKEISKKDQNVVSGQYYEDISLRKIGTAENPVDTFDTYVTNLRPKIYESLLYILLFVSFISVLRSVYGLYLNPTIPFILVVSMFTLVFCWNLFVILERKSSRIGRVLDSTTREPINGVKIEVQKDKFESAVSDTNGNVRFEQIGKKEKIKVVNMPTYRLLNSNQNEEIVVEFNKDGFMASDIILQRIKPDNIAKSPFSN